MDAEICLESLRVDAPCPLCLGYVREPVILQCGHTFCQECLPSSCREICPPTACPVCRTAIAFEDMGPDRTLRDLTDISKMQRPPFLQGLGDLPTCDQHGLEPTLFCEEDLRPLCGSCFLTTDHQKHRVVLLEEAESQCTEKLEAACQTLRTKKKRFQMELQLETIREAQWAKDGRLLQALAVSEYEKMRQFLREEEEIQLQTLGQEARDNGKNQKSPFRKNLHLLMKAKKQPGLQAQKQAAKSEWDKQLRLLSEEKELHLRMLDREATDNLAKFAESKSKMKQEIHRLEMAISELEENYVRLPVEMLQGAKGALGRSEELLLRNPVGASPTWTLRPVSGMRAMLLSFHRPLRLDPQTAHPHLALSEDLQSVEYRSVPQDVPDNPERFDSALCVLAEQKFSSGRHYWEVGVGEQREWEVGVCEESIRRKGAGGHKVPADRLTLAAFSFDRDFHLWHSNQIVPSCKPVQTLGIFLDYERGHIAFYNAADATLIYSPPDKAFQGPLLPWFSPCFPKGKNTSGYLHICPRRNSAQEDDRD
ncbi:probable E3 ubiquitin-protein ligase TRIML1 [Antechinus flavipes]|uniref:probable E3 ubiquitin-protein ligase TRIML1 n=1 Tax=Antechinus flavipes TaxID=38775 RepID=UPI00223562AB|nr:probable E3 ubiquitin-protein ligase TRIML1 [Antechinus flavipes]